MFLFDVPQEKLERVKFLIIVTNEKLTFLSPPVGDTSENEIGRVLIGRNCSIQSNIHWGCASQPTTKTYRTMVFTILVDFMCVLSLILKLSVFRKNPLSARP